MTLEVTLTFNNTTATIVSNEDGMFDLNDIWRDFDLKASQAPSQWRGKYREHLTSSANLQTINGRGGKTLATKKALFAYASWVDVEFHDVVFEAFELLTEGKTDEAKEVAQSVAKVREALRKDHGHVTGAIKEACYSRQLGMKIEHACMNFFREVCRAATGMTPKQFREKHGLDPRDALEKDCDIEGLNLYRKLLNKVETCLELGMTYDEIKPLLFVTAERYNTTA